jgi:cellobiose phosphorylase
LRMVYAGLFGMRFESNSLSFAPTLPQGWGEVTLSGLHYRGAVLTIHLRGAGDAVRSFRLDGRVKRAPQVPAGLKGAHTISIELMDKGPR